MIRFSTYMKSLWMGNYGLKNILQHGRIEVYSEAQPTSANDAATGTLLGLITQEGAVFTPNDRSNGALQITQTSAGVLVAIGNWRLTVSTSGTAGWFRFHGNYADDNLADTQQVHIRMDGEVGTDLLIDQPFLIAGQVRPIQFYLQFGD
jgi:hypothetical protein